ncbi:MAG: RlmE family RNA methyltransferase [Pelagibacteraceae bacterium]|jgi:23S rRNA (uridine2552-2'-O)-methyltransferase|nr:RlmE family RNA methyltransferase [Pelagibacteraceae bacterium]MBT6197815.1 RlmE family RNA methyltransferase [Pelagibacteraceae bacterium]
MKSKDWLNRQKRDHFVKKAKKKGYLSRAAFKLVEIENKYKVIEKSKYVLEFGASPGGWSQVVLEVNPRIKITALDVLDFKLNHPNIFFHKEDYLNFNYDKLKKNFDLILSDIAPNTTGHQSTDHLRISNMIFDIIKILDKILAKNGVFICKIWKGSEEKELIKTLKSKFNTVSYFKPESSRKDSSEIFIVAINFLI